MSDYLRHLLWFMIGMVSFAIFFVLVLRDWPWYLAFPFLAITMAMQFKLFTWRGGSREHHPG